MLIILKQKIQIKDKHHIWKKSHFFHVPHTLLSGTENLARFNYRNFNNVNVNMTQGKHATYTFSCILISY